jgi:hypothetical protein
MLHIDDTEIDLGQVEGKLQQLECERDYAREILNRGSCDGELLENLEAWGEHFREMQHGATLTILRARKTICDQSARIAWLGNQWEETKELLHAVGAGRVDSRLRRNVEEALMHLETNYDIDGASMKDSDAARKLRSAISPANA